VNNNILDTYQLKSQNAILDANVIRIERRGDQLAVVLSFVRADEVHKELLYDRVIACTGFRFDASLFDEACSPDLVINGRFPAQTPGWESVNVPDLFFAGTLMQQRDYRKSTTGFIHGFRYCVRSLSRMLADRYHGTTWPRRTIRCDPRSLTETVIERVNRTSALWQLFGYMADVLICHDNQAGYLQEVPVDYVHEGRWGQSDNYFLITLEYGPDHASVDPFDVSVVRVAQDDAGHASDAHYLHPVIRHYSRGRLLAEHHVAENLENQWNGPAHFQPLERFFAGRLAKTDQPQRAGATNSK
jgi:hypothetical protein